MSINSNLLAEHWLSLLKSSGYKLTGPRYYVVEIMTRTDKALTASDIYYLAHEHYPSIGLVSVYRTLEKLEILGLIQRVHRQDQCHQYIAAPQGHEHLLVCESCGRVIFFQGDNLKNLIKGVEHDTGYQVQGHWLQLSGVCLECQRAKTGDLGAG